MRCTRCQQDNPGEARFCLRCGTALGITCGACAAMLPPEASFCPNCGQPVPAGPSPASYTPRHLTDQILGLRGQIEGERKQVSVLFCDIVQSTALAVKLGPEGFHGLMEAFFRVALAAVHRYEGTVNQFLGDGFMALFGAPIAHEDHARRATLAALEIVRSPDVQLRIGINSGLVVVGTIGDDLRLDYTAFGDTTILAARLQAIAAPDEVLISERTADMVRGYFQVEPAPEVEVKGRPVRPVRVTGPGRRRSRLDSGEPLTPFIGRNRELAELQRVLEVAVSGDGQVLGIDGEPGLGKSRLVWEFRPLAERSANVLEGRCVSFGSGMPYLPLLDLVRSLCAIGPGDTARLAAGKVGQTLAARGLDPGLGGYLLHALGMTTEEQGLASVDAPTIRSRTFQALRLLLLASAKDRPLAVLIEDLHWIDRTSEQFLTEFVDELASAPVLLLVTYRPGYAPPWLGKSFASQIALRVLSVDASEQVVAARVADGDRRLITAIAAKGEGNPFFLEELARASRDEPADPVEAGVPTTVQDVLAARIDRLTTSQKRAIQVAAVLGREFSASLARRLWDGAAALDTELVELKRQEFLRERHDAREPTFVFKHALTREVAYASMLETRRRDLHGKAAVALEDAYTDRLFEHCELLAYHYANSSDRERAVEYLALANRKASARHALDEAMDYFYRALAIFEELPGSAENRRRRLALVVDQLNAFHFLHRNVGYRDLLVKYESDALALQDAELLGGLYCQLGLVLGNMGHHEAGAQNLEKALEHYTQAGDRESMALPYAGLIMQHAWLGRLEEAVWCHQRARECLAVAYSPFSYQITQGHVGLTYMLKGDWEAAFREVDEGMATGAERSDDGIVSFCAIIGSFAALEMRDFARAREYANRALASAPTDYYRGFSYVILAATLCHTGAYEQGLPILEQAVSVLKAAQHKVGWDHSALHLADAYIISGQLAEAAELLKEIEESTARDHAVFYAAASRRRLAGLALRAGDADEALHWLSPATEALRAIGAENEWALALGALGLAQRMKGDEGAARASLAEAVAALDRLGTLGEPDRIRALLAPQSV